MSMLKLHFTETLPEDGYYLVRYQDRSSSIPDEIMSTKELLEYIATRIEVKNYGLWSITIEKRGDWEKKERAELKRLKEKYGED